MDNKLVKKCLKPMLWLSTIFLIVLTLSKVDVVEANPQGGVVAAGNASINANGTTTQITQTTNQAVINWQSFNIASNEKTQFVQPSTQSAALNRVSASQGTSTIAGSLSANGQIWLVNPAGIFFSSTAMVDVAGLVATTANISDSDFLSGNYHFTNGQNSVINNGRINITNGGFAALIAPTVENNGVIRANLGKVALGAGSDFTLDFYGDNLINFDAGSSGKSVSNSGKIIANGGTVLLTAQAAQNVVGNVINMSGVIQANSVAQHNGTIILSGGRYGIVNVSGKLIATGRHHGQTGGTIKILGDEVALTGNADVTTVGSFAGGTILIGGDEHGTGVDQNATYTYVGPNTVINASAIDNGNGGTVVVWSDSGTQVYGTINAEGGALGGNGGFVETSGAYLDVNGSTVNTTAPQGIVGTWLLDPTNIYIAANQGNATTAGMSGTDASANTGTGTSPETFAASGVVQDSLLTTGNLNAALGSNNVVVTTTNASGTGVGNIIIVDPVTWSSTKSLTLTAANTVTVNASVTATGGGAITINAGGAVNVISTTVSSAGGNISFTGTGTATNTEGINLSAATISSGAGNITLTGTGFNGINNGVGVNLKNGASVSTSTGIITITGTGKGSGISNFGVQLSNGSVTSSSNGTINITGTGTNNTDSFGIETISTGNTIGGASDTGSISLTSNSASGMYFGYLAGSIESGGTIQTTGTVTLTASGGGNVTESTSTDPAVINAGTLNVQGSGTFNLNSTANTVSTLTGNLSSGGSLIFVNTAAPLTIATLTENGGNLTLSNAGTITQSGAITINGTTTFTESTANSDILLASAANNFSTTPVFTNNGNIRDLALRNTNASAVVPTLPTGLRNLTLSFDNTGIALPGITVTGTLSATTGNGAVTQTGIISANSVNISSTTGTTLNNNSDAISNVTITNTTSGNIVVNDASNISLTATNNNGNLTITAPTVTIVSVNVSGQTFITTQQVTGTQSNLITTGSLVLNDGSNLYGSIGGQSGLQAAKKVQLERVLQPGKDFFNGYDLYYLSSITVNPAVVFLNTNSTPLSTSTAPEACSSGDENGCAQIITINF